MTTTNWQEIKIEMMEPDWTESMHMRLEEIPNEDAKNIVDSMDESEIFQKINHRHCQEDYIADYIEYLWDISEDAYWKHIIISLNTDENIGLLWSDNMSYVDKMCELEIPKDVLYAVLKFIHEYTSSQYASAETKRVADDLEVISDVIKAQVREFSRMNEISAFAETLDITVRPLFLEKIELMLHTPSSYQFYKSNSHAL